MKPQKILLLATCLGFLCGCSLVHPPESPPPITPVPRTVQGLTYGPAQGSYKVERTIKTHGHRFDGGHSTIMYNARKIGDDLQWDISFKEEAFEKTNDMDITLTSDSSGRIVDNAITARMNGSVEVISSDAQKYGFVANQFNGIFLPLLSHEAREGDVVSLQAPMTEWKYAQKYNNSITVTLSGETVHDETPCYVFKFYHKSEPFKGANREMREDVIEGSVLVDQKTMLIVYGQSTIREFREWSDQSDYAVVTTIRATDGQR